MPNLCVVWPAIAEGASARDDGVGYAFGLLIQNARAVPGPMRGDGVWRVRQGSGCRGEVPPSDVEREA